MYILRCLVYNVGKMFSKIIQSVKNQSDQVIDAPSRGEYSPYSLTSQIGCIIDNKSTQYLLLQ